MGHCFLLGCYFYVTDGWKVYPCFIDAGDHIVCKTYMTRVEGENTRLRHYQARLKRKSLCYSKSVDMLKHSIILLLNYLKYSLLKVQRSIRVYLIHPVFMQRPFFNQVLFIQSKLIDRKLSKYLKNQKIKSIIRKLVNY